MSTFSVLFVCAGNRCRSPIAELTARALIAEQFGAHASRFDVASAGTEAASGLPIHEESAAALELSGIDTSSFAGSRQATASMLAAADVVLTADRKQRSRVVQQEPSVLPKTFTIREFARLLSSVDPDSLPADPVARAHDAVEAARNNRGLTPPGDPAADDILDPQGRDSSVHHAAVEAISAALSSSLGLETLRVERIWWRRRKDRPAAEPTPIIVPSIDDTDPPRVEVEPTVSEPAPEAVEPEALADEVVEPEPAPMEPAEPQSRKRRWWNRRTNRSASDDLVPTDFDGPEMLEIDQASGAFDTADSAPPELDPDDDADPEVPSESVQPVVLPAYPHTVETPDDGGEASKLFSESVEVAEVVQDVDESSKAAPETAAPVIDEPPTAEPMSRWWNRKPDNAAAPAPGTYNFYGPETLPVDAAASAIVENQSQNIEPGPEPIEPESPADEVVEPEPALVNVAEELEPTAQVEESSKAAPVVAAVEGPSEPEAVDEKADVSAEPQPPMRRWWNRRKDDPVPPVGEDAAQELRDSGDDEVPDGVLPSAMESAPGWHEAIDQPLPAPEAMAEPVRPEVMVSRPSAGAVDPPQEIRVSILLWLGCLIATAAAVVFAVADIDDVRSELERIVRDHRSDESQQSIEDAADILLAATVGLTALFSALEVLLAGIMSTRRSWSRTVLAAVAVLSIAPALASIFVVSTVAAAFLWGAIGFMFIAGTMMYLPSANKWLDGESEPPSDDTPTNEVTHAFSL